MPTIPARSCAMVRTSVPGVAVHRSTRLVAANPVELADAPTDCESRPAVASPFTVLAALFASLGILICSSCNRVPSSKDSPRRRPHHELALSR